MEQQKARNSSSIRQPKFSFSLQVRRKEALERQRQSRYEQLDLVRQLTHTCLIEQQQESCNEQAFIVDELHPNNIQDVCSGNDDDVKMEDAASSKQMLNGRRQRYVGQLMLPDWMLEVPHDLQLNWLVAARPEGQQCLVVACRGRVITRLRSGRTLHKLRGTPLNKISKCGLTLLDAVFNTENQIYYIMDVLCWKDFLMVQCQAEFRIFWLHQQISPELILQKDKGIQFQVCNYQMQCQIEQLKSMKECSNGFVCDGLFFVHKQGHYQIDSEAPSPLAIRWKDATCSPYPIDTDQQGNVEQQQVISLRIEDDLSLVTIDDPGVKLGCVSQFQNYSSIQVANLKPGKTVRTKLLSDIQVGEDGFPLQLPQLIFVTISRGRPDSWSRILFQYNLRCGKSISFQQILDASCTQFADMEC